MARQYVLKKKEKSLADRKWRHVLALPSFFFNGGGVWKFGPEGGGGGGGV